MDIKRFNPTSLKQPTNSYSNGVLISLGGADLYFVTGQIAQENDGSIVAPLNATLQTDFVFKRIAAILDDVGMSMDDVVKAQIFLTDMKDLPTVSKIRNEYFKNSRPVSTLVEVSRLVKEGCCVEIEVIAARSR